MIGEKPKSLAISLYSELITDKIWSLQRKKWLQRCIPQRFNVKFCWLTFYRFKN